MYATACIVALCLAGSLHGASASFDNNSTVEEVEILSTKIKVLEVKIHNNTDVPPTPQMFVGSEAEAGLELSYTGKAQLHQLLMVLDKEQKQQRSADGETEGERIQEGEGEEKGNAGQKKNATVFRRAILPPAESGVEFVGNCVAHVRQLVLALDQEYTDVQLRSVLESECHRERRFPESHSTGFRSHRVCMDFAKRLSDARMYELNTGRTCGYTAFCEAYMVHLTTYEPLPSQKCEKEEKTKSGTVAVSTRGFSAFVALAAVVAAWLS